MSGTGRANSPDHVFRRRSRMRTAALYRVSSKLSKSWIFARSRQACGLFCIYSLIGLSINSGAVACTSSGTSREPPLPGFHMRGTRRMPIG